MRASWITWEALNPITSVLRKRGEDRGEGNVERDTETGVMHLQARECWQSLEAGGGKDQNLS